MFRKIVLLLLTLLTLSISVCFAVVNYEQFSDEHVKLSIPTGWTKADKSALNDGVILQLFRPNNDFGGILISKIPLEKELQNATFETATKQEKDDYAKLFAKGLSEAYQNVRISDYHIANIGGKSSFIENIVATASNNPVKIQIVHVMQGEFIYVFVGVAPVNDWRNFNIDFMMLQDSITFH